MKVSAIAQAVEKIVPLKLAQDWDKVGLLVGDPTQNVNNILLTIDTTAPVVAEAKKLRTDLIIAYHPLIWDPLKTVTSDGPGRVVYELVRSRISLFAIHTALDAAVGGVNDGLAEILGIRDAEPIGDYVPNPAGDTYKLVVYVPADAVEKVSDALFAAGAGHIGNYSHCGYRSPGQGSFLPLEGANPAIGKKGIIEKVPEIRFETIVPAPILEKCIAAMKKAHPYETPAYDCFRLYNPADRFGLGRIGRLDRPAPLDKLIKQIKDRTGAKAVGLIGPAKKLIKTAAVCAGTCGLLLNQVIAAKADLYLPGELKHHQALAAQQAGLACICLSHTVSERFILKKFAKQLHRQLPSVTINISKKDADPFTWKEI